MTREDLFAAIGLVEESRLAKTEEDGMMKGKMGTRVARNLLIAAVIVSMLAVTAFAATGLLLYDSPAEMIAAIFGDSTGYDHKEITTWTEPGKSETFTNPAYDRVEADPTVVEEVAPHVSPVGQAISWEGYTLTVDSLLYDSHTGCGILTYTVENPEGVTGYTVENNGEVWGFPVNFNQYSKDYIIQEKTTPTCLAVTSYFYYRAAEDSTDVEITFSQWLKVTPGPEYQASIEALFEEIKTQYTPEEAIAAYIEEYGQESYDAESQENILQFGYGAIWAKKLEEMYTCPEVIPIDLAWEKQLRCVTLANGAAIVSPMAFQIDVETLDFLHTSLHGDPFVSADNIQSITIRYKDGTEYPVMGENLNNTAFVLNRYPESNVQTEIFTSDDQGQFNEVENSKNMSVLTLMFNRLIDIDQVDTILVNGVELKVD